MFTEFMYIALAVCLLLCAGTEGDLVYGMSFGTLLRASVMMIQVKCSTIWFSKISRTLLSKNEVRDKVRDNALTSVYCWSSVVLRPVS